eukprot:7819627-Karenia_brevis.AAC.1
METHRPRVITWQLRSMETALDFFVYNDDYRRGISRADIACTMSLPGSWTTIVFHAAALLYERVEDDM